MERYLECPIGEISQVTLQGSGDYKINVTILFSATTILSAVFQPIK